MAEEQATDYNSLDSVTESLLTNPTATEEAPEPQEEAQPETVEEELDAAGEDAEEEIQETELDETTEDEVPMQPEMFNVKIDGQETQVTLEELKRSYSGQGYIQKQMAEAAELKTQADAELQTNKASNEQLLKQIEQLQLQQPNLPKPPDPELLNSDPIQYMKEMELHRASKEQADALASKQLELQAKQAQEAEEQMKQIQQQEAKLLVEKIPELKPTGDKNKDKEAIDKFRSNLTSEMTYYGFNPEDLATITDHRAISVLNDAVKWRKLQSNKADVGKKVENARPVVKAGVKQRGTEGKAKAERVALDKMKSTGNLDDVARYLQLS